MKYKIIAAFVLLLSTICSNVNAQDVDNKELIHKNIYNKLEFFLNSQQTDSIYNMGNSKFHAEFPKEKLTNFLKTTIYPLGRIVNSSFVSTSDHQISTYQISFANKQFLLNFGFDPTTYKLNQLLFESVANKQPSQVRSDSVSTSAPSAKNTASDTLKNNVSFLAEQILIQNNQQSVAIAMIKNNRVKTYFFKNKNIEESALPSEDTVFPLTGLSKIFTATLIAKAYGEGILAANQAISSFLPDSLKSNSSLNKITIGQLVNHTSGLPLFPKNYTSGKPLKNYTKAHLFSFLKNNALDETKAETYEYSETGYALLGIILNSVERKSFEQSLQTSITQPLQLNNTHEMTENHVASKSTSKNVASGPLSSYGLFSPALGISSTLKDLITYTQKSFEMPEEPVTQAMSETRQFTFFLPPNTDIGMEWKLDIKNEFLVNWQSSHSKESSIFWAEIPDDKSAVIILTKGEVDLKENGFKLLNSLIPATVE